MAETAYIFGPTCFRDALVMLTGITSYLLSQARDAALQGHSSALSVHEVGLHACIRNQSKPQLYLSARQWLDNYASTHAEMSPMDYKALLLSGRNLFLLLPVPKGHVGAAWVSIGPLVI